MARASLVLHKAQLKLIGASGLPGFWSVFGLFGRFWSVSGPRGSVCRDIKSVNTASTRRIYPRSPEASTIFIFVDLFGPFRVRVGPFGLICCSSMLP